MNRFDNASLGVLKADIQLALAAVGLKHGLKLSLGGFSYAEHKASIKLTALVNTPEALAKEAPPAWVPIGKRFVYQGAVFIVVGYSARSYKYPIKAVDSEGRKFGFHRSIVRDSPALLG